MVQMFVLTRMWAMVTGLVLVVAYVISLNFGFKASEILPMLIAAIGGFELFLFSQDIWLKRKNNHG